MSENPKDISKEDFESRRSRSQMEFKVTGNSFGTSFINFFYGGRPIPIEGAVEDPVNNLQR